MPRFSTGSAGSPHRAGEPAKVIRPDADYAVVAGLDLNGLGVVRALASAGIPVVGLDSDLNKPTAATRHAVNLRVNTLSGDQFIAELIRLRALFGSSPVLFLTQEASVRTVSAAREKLAGIYRFTLPPHSVMEDLLDKIRFHGVAEHLGFPVPRSVNLTGAEDMQVLQQLAYPCVFKPAAKNAHYGQRFAKAYKVEQAGEAARLWNEVRNTVSRVTVQEWIEGEDSEVFFCLQYRNRSGAVASFAGRKLCQWPPLVGGTASCVPAPEHASAELKHLTDRFFTAVGFAGMGSMEYKRDRRDAKFYLVEPTVGRTDYQEEIATLNGANIPVAAFQSELGMPVTAQYAAKTQFGWCDPVGYARARQVGARDPVRELAPGITMRDAYFRIDDPMPYIALKLQSVRQRLARLAERGKRGRHAPPAQEAP